MRILITGANGQLGLACRQKLSQHVVIPLTRQEADITQQEAIASAIEQTQPDVVIHCAAYTHVDNCTKQPDLAYRINGLGAQNVALACQAVGAAMVHISTNEVFAGTLSTGYEEWMPLNPMNGYGRSKAAGEFHVRHVLPQHYIVRTAWLYAETGRNFIHAILQRARTTREVQVVTDEVGNPTYVNDLAVAIGKLIETKQYGTYHLVNAGSCSRWAFANEILRLAGLTDVRNKPILSHEFKRLSTPPQWGALKNIAGNALGISLRPWQGALADYMNQSQI